VPDLGKRPSTSPAPSFLLGKCSPGVQLSALLGGHRSGFQGDLKAIDRTSSEAASIDSHEELRLFAGSWPV
jgi:hypothetical protein